MTPHSNPDLREAAEALRLALPIVQHEYDQLVNSYGNGNIEEIEERFAYNEAVEARTALAAIKQALALTASASGGEPRILGVDIGQRHGDRSTRTWGSVDETGRVTIDRVEEFNPSAPTYNVSRLEFDQWVGETKVLRAWVEEVRKVVGLDLRDGE